MERLKVLLSAYACEPGKGSEPEVGWQWALQMARFHQVTVLTRANNEPSIAAALRRLPVAVAPRFVYFDLRPPFLALKRRFRLHKAYHSLWQRSAVQVVRGLLKNERFDLLHHVTFAAARHPTAVLGHGVPSIFGPVGGFESVPASLLPWKHPPILASELARNSDNLWQSIGPNLRRKAASATIVLASTLETQRVLNRLGVLARLMPAIGLDIDGFPPRHVAPDLGSAPLRLLFVGNVLYLKGLELAVRALALSNPKVRLGIIGDGPFLPELHRLGRKLGISDRLEFHGRLGREETLRAYADYHVFVYPSLHDSGGFALLEAMANELPAICLDCGGPALAVTPDCGIKVPLGSHRDVVRNLSEAIDRYAGNADLRAAHGRGARERVAAEYDWRKKAVAMNDLYREAVAR